jgi:hypothetical protein
LNGKGVLRSPDEEYCSSQILGNIK